MNGRNAKTITLVEGQSLVDSPVVELPTGTPSIIGMGGSCQLIIKRSGIGSSVTFLIEEYFNEDTGWINKCEDDAGVMMAFGKSSEESSFSYSFSSLANKLRFTFIGGAGTEVVDAYLVVGEIV